MLKRYQNSDKEMDKGKKILDGFTKFYGSKSAAARRAGVSPSYLYRVLMGERKSTRVMKVAAKVLLEYERKEQAAQQEIADAIEKAGSIAAVAV